MANIRYVESAEWENDTTLQPKLSTMFSNSDRTGVWSIYTNGGWSGIRTGGCFGDMPNTPGIVAAERIRVILHGGMGGKSTHAQKEWWHTMILDRDTSPWKDALLEEPIIYLGNTEKFKYKSVLDIKVQPSQSFSNVMNMLIATRQSKVEPSSVSKVSKLYNLHHKSLGMTFAEALAYAIILHRDNGKIVTTPTIFVSGNGWLSVGRDFDPRYMAQQKFAKSVNPFTSGDYYPSCSTWQSGVGVVSMNKYFSSLGEKADIREPIMKYDWGGNLFRRQNFRAYEASAEQVLLYLRSKIE